MDSLDKFSFIKKARSTPSKEVSSSSLPPETLSTNFNTTVPSSLPLPISQEPKETLIQMETTITSSHSISYANNKGLDIKTLTKANKTVEFLR
jgi:hypothetical protein